MSMGNQRQPRFDFLFNDEIDSTIPDLAKITMIDKWIEYFYEIFFIFRKISILTYSQMIQSCVMNNG